MKGRGVLFREVQCCGSVVADSIVAESIVADSVVVISIFAMSIVTWSHYWRRNFAKSIAEEYIVRVQLFRGKYLRSLLLQSIWFRISLWRDLLLPGPLLQSPFL